MADVKQREIDPNIEPEDLSDGELADIELAGKTGLSLLPALGLMAFGIFLLFAGPPGWAVAIGLGSAWSPIAVAIIVTSLGAYIASELTDSLISRPLRKAGNAARSIANAAGKIVQGKFYEAAKTLASVPREDWIALVVVIAVVAFLASKIMQKKRRKRA